MTRMKILVLLNVFSVIPHCQSADGGQHSQDPPMTYVKDKAHYASFDPESILGSLGEAGEFNKLSAKEAKMRLSILVGKMDTSGDGMIEAAELKNWILASFTSFNKEESKERFKYSDANFDGVVTWHEYRQEDFDIDIDENLESFVEGHEWAEEWAMLEEDIILFEAADKDKNKQLTEDEFLSFSHPEEDLEMTNAVLECAKHIKDKNNNGRIDYEEFIGDNPGKDRFFGEKEHFDEHLDKDQDGNLSDDEIIAWLIPDTEEIVMDEIDQIFSGADKDANGLLSKDEILNNYHLFVGGEVTNYGEMLHNKEEL